MDDTLAVMDDAGMERAALIGHFDSAAVFALFAATYPERTTALVIVGGFAKGSMDETFPIGPDPEVYEVLAGMIDGGGWGQDQFVPFIAPSMVDDPAFREWWARYERACTSPGAAAALFRMVTEIDVRDVLPTIRVPTLVVHQDRHPTLAADNARYLAEHIPGARLAILPGIDALPYTPDGGDAVMDEIEEFLTGARARPTTSTGSWRPCCSPTSSTPRREPSELGDHAWRDLLDRHDDVVRRQLGRFRGDEVKSTGDGFLATFDGPAPRHPVRTRDPRRTSTRSARRSAPASTPARSSGAVTTSAASPCTSARACPRWRARVRCWCRAR